MECLMNMYFSLWVTTVWLTSWHSSAQGISVFDRVCPESCGSWVRCCLCKATPRWMSLFVPVSLDIYFDNSSSRSFVRSQDGFNESTLFTADCQHGVMEKLPFNLCNFPKLVHIDFSDNQIREISNISCLRFIDTINLSYNRIRIFTKDTFKDNTYLRVLDLSFNFLFKVEPDSFAALSNMQITLVHNQLSSIDITNFLLMENPFCYVNASYNEITEFTNQKNRVSQNDKSYGPGFVDLRSNKFRYFPNSSSIGLTEPSQLGKYEHISFDIRDNPWLCDCSFAPFAVLYYPLFQVHQRDFYHIGCQEPQALRGRTFYDIVIKKDVHLYKCELTRTDDCPQSCRCYFQPVAGNNTLDLQTNITVINCTGAGLTRMPKTLPEGTNYELDLSFNNITTFEYKYYLSKLKALNLSMNRLNVLSDDGIYHMQKLTEVDLSGNSHISIFPKSLFQISPCRFKVSQITIKCSCQHMEVKKWLKFYEDRNISCSFMRNFHCETGMTNLLITDVPDAEFNCEIQKAGTVNPFAVLIGLVVSIAALTCILSVCRFELQIIFRRCFACPRKKEKKEGHDLYISFHDNDTLLRTWVLSDLVPKLESTRFRVFVPVRDLVFGSARNEEMSEAISISRNFLCLFSEQYFNEESKWTNLEWRHIWNYYMSNKHRKLIVLNYAFLRIKDIHDRKAKAFMRFGSVMNFSNVHKNLHSRLRSAFE